MGVMLTKIYDIVTKKAGFEGRLRLAVMTGLSKEKALNIEDTDELVSKFKLAAKEIIGEDIDKFLEGGE